jgi:hypothetical protein
VSAELERDEAVDGLRIRNGWQNERSQAIRAVSRAVWRYYHPNDKWSPPAGVEKYQVKRILDPIA